MSKRPDYGIDAPRVLAMFFVLGILCPVLGIFARPFAVGEVTVDFGYAPQITGGIFLLEGVLMFVYVRLGQFRHRDGAVGIDIWSMDQSDNSRESTLRNATLEGVAQRVTVHDGDMRKMPFADRSFDATVAHFAIHNVRSREGRREAIREIVRTLNQGGQVAISDIISLDLYADELRKSDMLDVEISDLSFWTFPPARTVTARKPSQPA